MGTFFSRLLTAAFVVGSAVECQGAESSSPGSETGQTFVVTTALDESDGPATGGVSLREAIELANAAPGADSITFDLALPTTITLTAPLPNVTGSLTIDGPGTTALAVSGNDMVPLFAVNSGDFALRHLVLAEGYARGGKGGDAGFDTEGAGGGGAGLGGALLLDTTGTALIENVVFSGNRAEGGRGGKAAAQGGVSGVGSGGGTETDGGTSAAGGRGFRLAGSSPAGGAPECYPAGNGGIGAGGGSSSGRVWNSDDDQWETCDTYGKGNNGGFGGGGAGSTDDPDGGQGGYGGGGGAPGGRSEAFGGKGGSSYAQPWGGGNYNYGYGGGGAGLGGAVFVRRGKVVLNRVHLAGNSAAGGVGPKVDDVPPVDDDPYYDGWYDAGNGQGKGGALFIHPDAAVSVTQLTGEGNTADSATMTSGMLMGVHLDTPDVYGTLTSDAPSVVSFTADRTAPTSATAATFTIRFHLPVTGVDGADFEVVVLSGDIQTSVTGVAGAEAEWKITVGTDAGSGVVGLRLIDDGTIVDAATGTPLAGDGDGGMLSQSNAEFDHQAPTLTLGPVTGLRNSQPDSVVARFSEPVAGFTASEIALTRNGVSVPPPAGGGHPILLSGGDWSLLPALEGSDEDGTYTLTVNAGGIADRAGNPLAGGPASVTWLLDRTRPRVDEFVRLTPSPTTDGDVVYRVTFSEPVTWLDLQGGVGALAVPGLSHASVEVTPLAPAVFRVTFQSVAGSGTLTPVLSAGAVQDVAGNHPAGDATGPATVVDNHGPSILSIDTGSLAGPTSSTVVELNLHFSEPVTGFGDPSDMIFSGPELSWTTWTAVMVAPRHARVTLSGILLSGDLSVVVPAGACTDALGQPSASYERLGLLRMDTVPPTVTITREGAELVNNTAASWFKATFSEPVSLFTSPGQVEVVCGEGVTTGTVSDISWNGLTNTGEFNLRNFTGNGVVSVGIPAGAVRDWLGNPSQALPPAPRLTLDQTPPTVQGEPVVPGLRNTNPSRVRFKFSEPVRAQNGRVRIEAPPSYYLDRSLEGEGTDWEAPVDEGGPDGEFRAWIDNPSAVTDLAGNSMQSGAEVQWTRDTTPPAVASIILQGPARTNGTSVTFQVKFAEAVTGFEPGDVTVTVNGCTWAGLTVTTATATATATATVYDVTVNGVEAGVGSLRIAVKAGAVADQAGNSSPASADGPVVTIDQVPLRITGVVYSHREEVPITGSPDIPGFFRVVFNKSDVTGFGDPGDVTLAGDGFAVGNAVFFPKGSGTWDISLGGVTGDGPIVLRFPEGAAVDGAGNRSALYQSEPLLIMDQSPPTVTLTYNGPAVYSGNAEIEVLAQFSEPVTENGASSGIYMTAVGDVEIFQPGRPVETTTTRILKGSARGDGSVFFQVPADWARDAGRKGNLASNVIGPIQINTRPGVSGFSRRGPEVTSATSVSYRIEFSEGMTGFGDQDDLTVLPAPGQTWESLSFDEISSTTYKVTVHGIRGDGVLKVFVPENAGHDSDGGGNDAQIHNYAAFPVVTIDQTPPTAAFLAPYNINPSRTMPPGNYFKVTFSEAFSSFSVADLELFHNGRQVALGDRAASATVTRDLTAPEANRWLIPDVFPAAETGEWTLRVSNRVTDSVGNALAGVAETSWVLDVVRPEVTSIDLLTTDLTRMGDTSHWKVTFSKPVYWVGTNGIVPHCTSGTVVSGIFKRPANPHHPVLDPSAEWIVELTHLRSDTAFTTASVWFELVEGAAADRLGNLNLQSGLSPPIFKDLVQPDVQIEYHGREYSNGTSVSLTVTFTEPVLGFDPSDIIVKDETNTYLSIPATFTHDPPVLTRVGPRTYSVLIDNLAVTESGRSYHRGGPVPLKFQIPHGSFHDIAGNRNWSEVELADSFNLDQTPPRIIRFSRSGAYSSIYYLVPSRAGYYVQCNELVSFDLSKLDYVTTGFEIEREAFRVDYSGNNFNVAFTYWGGTGSLTTRIGPGAITDLAGNTNQDEAGPLVDLFDNVPAAVTSIVPEREAVTSATTVSWLVTFNESVTGFGDPDDIELWSLVPLGGNSIEPLSDTVYRVTVEDVRGNGVLFCGTSAFPARDWIGWSAKGMHVYAGMPGNQITVDQTPPGAPVLTWFPSPRNTQPDVTVRFSEPVWEFTTSTIELSRDGVLLDLTGLGPDTITSTSRAVYSIGAGAFPLVEGVYTLRVRRGEIRDHVGNRVTTDSAPLTWRVDTTPPELVSFTRIGSAVTSGSVVQFEARFNEEVTGLASDHVEVDANGVTWSGRSVTRMSADTYRITLTGLQGDGTVGIGIAGGVIRDVATNPYAQGLRSDLFTVKQSRPTVAITSLNTSGTEEDHLSWSLEFSEPVVGLTSTSLAFHTPVRSDKFQNVVLHKVSGQNDSYYGDIYDLKIPTGKNELRVKAFAIGFRPGFAYWDLGIFSPTQGILCMGAGEDLTSGVWNIRRFPRGKYDTWKPQPARPEPDLGYVRGEWRSRYYSGFDTTKMYTFIIEYDENVPGVSWSGVDIAQTGPTAYTVTTTATRTGLISLELLPNTSVTDLTGNRAMPAVSEPIQHNQTAVAVEGVSLDVEEAQYVTNRGNGDWDIGPGLKPAPGLVMASEARVRGKLIHADGILKVAVPRYLSENPPEPDQPYMIPLINGPYVIDTETSEILSTSPGGGALVLGGVRLDVCRARILENRVSIVARFAEGELAGAGFTGLELGSDVCRFAPEGRMVVGDDLCTTGPAERLVFTVGHFAGAATSLTFSNLVLENPQAPVGGLAFAHLVLRRGQNPSGGGTLNAGNIRMQFTGADFRSPDLGLLGVTFIPEGFGQGVYNEARLTREGTLELGGGTITKGNARLAFTGTTVDAAGMDFDGVTLSVGPISGALEGARLSGAGGFSAGPGTFTRSGFEMEFAALGFTPAAGTQFNGLTLTCNEMSCTLTGAAVSAAGVFSSTGGTFQSGGATGTFGKARFEDQSITLGKVSFGPIAGYGSVVVEKVYMSGYDDEDEEGIFCPETALIVSGIRFQLDDTAHFEEGGFFCDSMQMYDMQGIKAEALANVITSRGLQTQGGAFDLLGLEFKFSISPGDPSGMRWSGALKLPENLVPMTGQFGLGADVTVIDSRIILNGLNFCTGFQNGGGVTKNGLRIKDSAFQIPELCIAYEAGPPKKFTGNIDVDLKAVLSLTAEVEVIASKLNKIGVALGNLNRPIGSTGAFLQEIGVFARYLARQSECRMVTFNWPDFRQVLVCDVPPVEMGGHAKVTAGPNVGGGALVSVNAAAAFSEVAFRLSGIAEVAFLDLASAFVDVSWSGPNAGVAFGGTISVVTVLEGSFKAFISTSGQVAAQVTLGVIIPRGWPLIGGHKVAEVGVAFQAPPFRMTGSLSVLGIRIGFSIDADGGFSKKAKERVAGWETSLWTPIPLTSSAGARGDRGGNYYLRLFTNFEPSQKFYSNEGFKAARDGATAVIPLTLGEADNTIIRLAYEREGGNPAFTIRTPSGETLTPENAAIDADNKPYASVAFVTNATTRDAGYLLARTDPGVYTVEILHPSTLGQYAVEVLVSSKPPQFTFNEVGVDGTELGFSWTDEDPDSSATIDLYLDTDHQGGDGIAVASGIAVEDETDMVFVDLASRPVPSGWYWPCAFVSDGVNPVQVVYGAQPVFVPEAEAPAAVRNLDVAALGPQAVLTWDPVDDPDLQLYKILWTDELDSARYSFSRSATRDQTSAIVGGLDQNRTYRFTVVAVRGAESTTGTRAAGLEVISRAARSLRGMETRSAEASALGEVALASSPQGKKGNEAPGQSRLQALADQAVELARSHRRTKLAGSGLERELARRTQARELARSQAREEGADTSSEAVFSYSDSPEVTSDEVTPRAPRGMNNNPVFTGEPSTFVLAGRLYQWQATATDEDAGDTITYHLVSGPENLTVTPEGLVTWRTDGSSPTWPEVAIVALDGRGGFAELRWHISVATLPPARSIRITSRPPTSVAPGGAYVYQPVLQTPFPEEPVAWTLITGAEGMSLDPATGRLSWTPEATQTGSGRVALRVTQSADGVTCSDFQEFVVTLEGGDDLAGISLLGGVDMTQRHTIIARHAGIVYSGAGEHAVGFWVRRLTPEREEEVFLGKTVYASGETTTAMSWIFPDNGSDYEISIRVFYGGSFQEEFVRTTWTAAPEAVQVEYAGGDTFSTSSTLWQPLGWEVPGTSYTDFDAATGAWRAHLSVAADREVRRAGRFAAGPQALTYGQIGPDRIARAKYSVYTGGQSDPSRLQDIPALRLRLAHRFAQSSILEVFTHIDADPGNTVSLELRPSSDPDRPSIYRVDLDPVDVPFLTRHAETETVVPGFEAYSSDPGDHGYIALTEISLWTYPASAAGAGVAPLQVLEPDAAGAGSLSVDREGAVLTSHTLLRASLLPALDAAPGCAGCVYREGTDGVTFDATGVGPDVVAVMSREFDAGPRGDRVRVEPGNQYVARFHVTSPNPVTSQSQIILRARSARFNYTMKTEIGGAWAAGPQNNALAQEMLPGVGCRNPDKHGADDANGGWYNVLMYTPLSREIRGEGDQSLDIGELMPLFSREPDPGVDAPSLRDLKVGADLLDSISASREHIQERSLFTIDRIEIRAYDAVPD